MQAIGRREKTRKIYVPTVVCAYRRSGGRAEPSSGSGDDSRWNTWAIRSPTGQRCRQKLSLSIPPFLCTVCVCVCLSVCVFLGERWVGAITLWFFVDDTCRWTLRYLSKQVSKCILYSAPESRKIYQRCRAVENLSGYYAILHTTKIKPHSN